ncbi:hypothetical protein DPMN_015349 [Dreissena polymorpha]|uniref:Uncharacterized protein n=1 Tax=Dreissena polymorpha TaxID=45954 RepID=A0A9D4S4C3_DREPO|nr:hypothetical protein DPMN_015349 [Dreissena polymorpha]
MVSTDNTSVVAYIQAKGGTHSQSLYLETKEITCFLQNTHILFWPNTYQVASTPWRMGCLANTDTSIVWTLHQEWTNQIFFKFGYPLVNLLATRPQLQTTSVCESSLRSSSVGNRPRFRSLGPTGSVRLSPTHYNSPNIGENQGELMPDTPDCPWWPRRSWFNDLLSLLYDYPRKLLTGQIFYQSGRLHADPVMFHLHVWRYQAISAEETFFCQGFNPRCFCKEKIHQSSL